MPRFKQPKETKEERKVRLEREKELYRQKFSDFRLTNIAYSSGEQVLPVTYDEGVPETS